MFESVIGDTVKQESIKETCPAQKPYWFQSLIEKFKKYKTEIFGAGDSATRSQRMLDYTVKPTCKFVFAKYSDDFYRPACIAGRCKKRQFFIVSFYHTKKCLYVKPTDIIFKHGNLLNTKVSFMQRGKQMKGKVFGNNSPANKGFPSIFYIRKKEKWHKIPFKTVFLTRKQFNKFKFELSIPEDKMDTCPTIDMETNCVKDDDIEELKELDEDFEMS